MNIFEIILIGFALSADAFVSSICKGITLKEENIKEPIIIGLYFGMFQSLMTLLGYILSNNFQDLIIKIDHWIAFILLSILGIKSIKETLSKQKEFNEKLDIKTMIILSVATSIDALAIGITFAFLDINIFYSSIIIGFITFTTSTLGAKIGNKVGIKSQKIPQLLGGIILIMIGIKILIEHLSL